MLDGQVMYKPRDHVCVSVSVCTDSNSGQAHSSTHDANDWIGRSARVIGLKNRRYTRILHYVVSYLVAFQRKLQSDNIANDMQTNLTARLLGINAYPATNGRLYMYTSSSPVDNRLKHRQQNVKDVCAYLTLGCLIRKLVYYCLKRAIAGANGNWQTTSESFLLRT